MAPSDINWNLREFVFLQACAKKVLGLTTESAVDPYSWVTLNVPTEIHTGALRLWDNSAWSRGWERRPIVSLPALLVSSSEIGDSSPRKNLAASQPLKTHWGVGSWPLRWQAPLSELCPAVRSTPLQTSPSPIPLPTPAPPHATAVWRSSSGFRYSALTQIALHTFLSISTQWVTGGMHMPLWILVLDLCSRGQALCPSTSDWLQINESRMIGSKEICA